MDSATPPRPRKRALLVVTAIYLALLGWLTLGPQPTNTTTRGLWQELIGAINRHTSIHNFTYNDLEFLANIAVFVPLGFLFVALVGRRRWWLSIVAGVLLTLAIEGTQFFLPTRVPDVRDLVANSTGAAIGTLLAVLLLRPSASSERRPLRSRVASR